MTKNEKDNLSEWFKKADHDLIAAHKLILIADILDTACFHCQQAAEKYLKAYLIFKGIEPERTHNLKDLQKDCAKFDLDFNAFDFKDLTHYASNARYPDDFSEPLPQEAQYYLELAEKVKEMVLRKVTPFL
ncbi:MAG TPA: HEPN domain-containing protein [Bacteroidia bacterium]|nr:HEPN domain-containing protein [Bacteroidia bacterium]